jgi:hypothetical protein
MPQSALTKYSTFQGLLIIACESLIVCFYHIASFWLRDASFVWLKIIREQPVCALLVKPLQLFAAKGEDPREDQAYTVLSALLGILQ